MHLCLCTVRIVDRRKAIALYLYGHGDYEEGYDVDFGCPHATEQQKTITDHSRNVIVILYIVFILNMVNILKVCSLLVTRSFFLHIYTVSCCSLCLFVLIVIYRL